MTLINCSEDCHFQHEGHCKLNHSATINSVRVNGCSYFKQKSKTSIKVNNKEKNKYPQA